ncbi:unnamed protein product [Lathyrus oleraceus]
MRMLKPLALFIFILCTIQPNNAEDVIVEGCHKAPKYFSKCVKYVKSYPNASPINDIGVVIIMVNIMRDKAMTTSTKINQLLAGGKVRIGTREYDALHQCADSYKQIATSDYRRIRANLPRGDPKVSLGIANGVLWKVGKCEVSFNGKSGDATPLTHENDEMTLVVSIAADIVDSFISAN